jgi:hypothetical protein
MPEAEPARQPDDTTPGGFSGYGIASAVLGVVVVASLVLIGMMWSSHRAAVGEREYQSRVLQSAAEWTSVLINMNTDNVDASLEKLRDKTVGELNTDFDASITPYREVVKLQASTTGQIESVSIEAVHRDLSAQPGQRPPAPPALPSSWPHAPTPCWSWPPR